MMREGRIDSLTLCNQRVQSIDPTGDSVRIKAVKMQPLSSFLSLHAYFKVWPRPHVIADGSRTVWF